MKVSSATAYRALVTITFAAIATSANNGYLNSSLGRSDGGRSNSITRLRRRGDFYHHERKVKVRHSVSGRVIHAVNVEQIYQSDPKRAANDWESDWSGGPNVLTTAKEVDPSDERATMRGSGSITFGNDKVIFQGSPRLYISKTVGEIGFENVEFTAYGRYIRDGEVKDFSGFTLVARSNHGYYKSNGCAAAGYYARIYRGSGEAAFQKEYYHGRGFGTIYTPSVRVQLFPDGIPLATWIGMKFVVYTNSEGNVQLELYVDKTGGVGGGNWELVHSFLDEPGKWYPSRRKSFPKHCEIGTGNVIPGGRDFCFLRSDGDDDTVVEWSKASIRNILPP